MSFIFQIFILSLIALSLTGLFGHYLGWDAASAIGTVFAVIILIFYNIRQDLRNKEEKKHSKINSEIIQPLLESLRSIIEYVPKGNLGNWVWPKIKKHPSVDKEISEKLENFSQNWERFKNLYHQRLDELNKLFFEEIFSYFCPRLSSRAQKIIKILSTHPNPQASVRNWYCYWQVGGKSFSTNFFELIFFKKSLQEFIEESKNDPEILNKEVSQIRCRIENEDVEKDDWDKIGDSIKKKVEENNTYTEYFGYSRQIYS